jgi:hypothetical protein
VNIHGFLLYHLFEYGNGVTYGQIFFIAHFSSGNNRRRNAKLACYWVRHEVLHPAKQARKHPSLKQFIFCNLIFH